MKTTTPTPLLRHALRCVVLACLLAAPASAQVVLDDFNGTAFDSATWYPRKTSGTAIVADGLAQFTTGALTTSQRSFVVSNNSYSPFAAPLTISFDSLVLTGTPTADAPTWGNAFYAAVGLAKTDLGAALDDSIAGKYTAVGADYVTALGLNVRRSDSNVVLQIVDRGANAHTTTTLTLSAVPTDIIWTIDGSGGTGTWSVNLTGATFTDTDLSSATGTFIKFNETELAVGGGSVSRLAFGAINVGPVLEVTGVTLDSVAIGAVPEPSSYALFASAFVGGVVVLRRRRCHELKRRER
ncbi:MAG: PEP-CTERM sorting domain-containing protein [Verrucomicrobiota bacterium]